MKIETHEGETAYGYYSRYKLALAEDARNNFSSRKPDMLWDLFCSFSKHEQLQAVVEWSACH